MQKGEFPIPQGGFPENLITGPLTDANTPNYAP